jgi:hypothetical protein
VLVCVWGDLVCARGEVFALGYNVRGEGFPHNTMRKGGGSLRTTAGVWYPLMGISRLL